MGLQKHGYRDASLMFIKYCVCIVFVVSLQVTLQIDGAALKNAGNSVKNKRASEALILLEEEELTSQKIWKAAVVAIERNMAGEIVRLVESPLFDPHYVDKDTGRTLLSVAVQENNADLVERLLEKGASVDNIGTDGKNNFLDKHKRSVFYYTRCRGCDHFTQGFIEKKERIINMLLVKSNPLFLTSFILEAAIIGNNFLLEFLVSKGVSLAVSDEGSITPLFSAIAGMQLETVRFLCSLGADPNVMWGETEEIGFANYLDIVIVQIERTSPETRDKRLALLNFLCTKIHDLKRSMRHVHDSDVKTMLQAHITLQEAVELKRAKKKAKRKKKKEKNVASLVVQEEELAAAQGQDVVPQASPLGAIIHWLSGFFEVQQEGKEIHENGNMLNDNKQVDEKLFKAAKKKLKEVARGIGDRQVFGDADAGADVKKEIKTAFFAVLYASLLLENDDEFFLDNLATMNMQNVDFNDSVVADGSTLLMYAVAGGREKIVRKLLQREALPEHENSKKETAFFIARAELADTDIKKAGMLSIIRMMIANVQMRKGELLPQIFFKAAQEKNPYIIQVMKEEGFSLDMRDSAGCTLMLQAVMRGDLDGVCLLYENGANIHELACVDTTYLAVAVNIASREDLVISPDRRAQFTSIAQFLCEKGIDLNNALGDACTLEMEKLVNLYRNKRKQEEKELCEQEAKKIAEDQRGMVQLAQYRERKERARRAREIQLLREEELAERALRIQEVNALKNEVQQQYSKEYEQAEKENAYLEYEYRAASINVAKELALQEQARRIKDSIQEADLQVDDRAGLLQLVKYWEHEERARRVREVQLLQESEQELVTQREEREALLHMVKNQEEQERVRRVQLEYERERSSASAVFWAQAKDAQDAQGLHTNNMIYLLGEIEKRTDLRQKLCISEPVTYGPDLFSVFLKHHRSGNNQQQYSHETQELSGMIAAISPGYKKRAKEGRLLQVPVGVYSGYELLFMAENSA